jgi:hypothetical protein
MSAEQFRYPTSLHMEESAERDRLLREADARVRASMAAPSEAAAQAEAAHAGTDPYSL